MPGKLRQVAIPAPYSVAADINPAAAAVGDRLAVFVQQINARAGDRTTNGWRAAGPSFQYTGCGNHGAFRGAVVVDHIEGKLDRWSVRQRISTGKQKA